MRTKPNRRTAHISFCLVVAQGRLENIRAPRRVPAALEASQDRLPHRQAHVIRRVSLQKKGRDVKRGAVSRGAIDEGCPQKQNKKRRYVINECVEQA